MPSSSSSDPSEPDSAHASDDADPPEVVATRVYAKASRRRKPRRKGGGPLDGRIEALVRARLFQETPSAARLGRFTVLEELGRGGMGTVYAAYDEQLDRKVAIKILREDELPGEEGRLRFQREAQAQARLSHPHVVAIHEVGNSDGQMYLAMEFIRGESLGTWLRDDRPLAEVLEVFVQAGEGLVAAHEAGLVHRDFKPHNVMRGDDGVVKVLDFGLARPVDEETTGQALLSVSGVDLDVSASRSASSLTVPGRVLGTPAYMSPEQHAGAAADARSDQYSFCVALWEALAGQRPFDLSGLVELATAKHEGPPPWPASAPSVPRRIVEALRRGLAVMPEQRWPSMRALLETLARDPGRRRNRWLLGLAGVVTLGLGGAVVQALTPTDPERCSGAAERLVGVWDGQRRADVETAVLAVKRSYTPLVWEAVEADLDAYADDWAAMHTEACQATALRGEQSPQMLDRRMACLRRAAMEMGATVDTLADADREVVLNAHELTAGLPPLSRCADTEALAADVEPPGPEQEETVEAARAELARAESLRRAGRFERARDALLVAKELLRAADYRPIQTEVALLEGRVLGHLGDYEASRSALLEALRLASEQRQWESMGAIANWLMYVVGFKQRRTEAGLLYRGLAQGLSRNKPRIQSAVRANLALILQVQGDYEAAEVEQRAVISLLEGLYGPNHHRVAEARDHLGGALQAQGKDAEAEAEHRAAISLLQRALGPNHPSSASMRNSLAQVLLKQGRPEEAEVESRVGLALQEAALGPDHPDVASNRETLGQILRAQGRFDQAEVEHRTSLALRERALGPGEVLSEVSRMSLALTLSGMERFDEAEVELRKALTRLDEKLGSTHPFVLAARINLAALLHKQGKHEESEEGHRAVLPQVEQALGPDHPHVALSRLGLADLLVDLGRAAEALPLAELAWARLSTDGNTPDNHAEAAFVLASALWDVQEPSRDRARAHALAEDALRLSREAGDAHRNYTKKVRRWLSSHRLD